MGITNGGQLDGLFLSCGFGFLLGLYYDVFRVARLIMHSSKRVIFFEDLFFFLSSAVITFFFSLTVTGGEMRLYLFFGILVGFAAYYFTIGRVVMAFAGAVAKAILFAWHWFWRLVFAPFRLLGRLLSRPLRFLKEKLDAVLKKIGLFLKKGLKRGREVLYNQKKRPHVTHVAVSEKQRSVPEVRAIPPCGSGFEHRGDVSKNENRQT